MYTLMLLKYLLKDAFMKTDLHLMANIECIQQNTFFSSKAEINKQEYVKTTAINVSYFASKFEGDCKYVQLWIFTHLTVFRFN